MSLSSMILAPLYDRLTRPSEEACVSTWRQELLAPLQGAVLEIGAGTGANLPHYGPSVESVLATEPDRHMRRRLEMGRDRDARIQLSDASAERLPMKDESFDVVVSTLVLCSVADPRRAVSEILRVLRPGGSLVFIEHVGASNNPERLRWQRRVEPIWKRLFGNCHLTRDTEALFDTMGLELEAITRESMRKAMPVVRPTIRGVARKR